MNRRSFFGFVTGAVAASALPVRVRAVEAPTDFPSPGPNWTLVTLMYDERSGHANVSYDGKLQVSHDLVDKYRHARAILVQAGVKPPYHREPWRIWVRRDAIATLKPDVFAGYNTLVAGVSTPGANAVRVADKLEGPGAWMSSWNCVAYSEDSTEHPVIDSFSKGAGLCWEPVSTRVA